MNRYAVQSCYTFIAGTESVMVRGTRNAMDCSEQSYGSEVVTGTVDDFQGVTTFRMLRSHSFSGSSFQLLGHLFP